MKLRWNKNYGLKLWICTNDQEICGFMTNDRRGRDLSIQKCDWCEDGFLIVKRGKKGYFLGCTNYKDDKSGCGRMLIKETTTPPQMTPVEKVKKRNSSSAYPRKAENLVKYTEQFIEKDGFMVITDPEGKIITDMALLSRLRSLRYKIALKNNIPVYMIANNAVLVRLATDKPTTTEEFLAIPGIGSHRCEAYGQLFINAIKKYITNQKDD